MTRSYKFSSKALILLNHSANDTSMNRMAKKRQQWNGEWAEFYYPRLDRQTIYERQLS